jgi:hypothetical protein
MEKIFISCWVESKKFFHSRVPLLTLLAALLIPFVGDFSC